MARGVHLARGHGHSLKEDAKAEVPGVDKLRIAAVLETFPVFSEVFLYRTLCALAASGWEVTVLARKRGADTQGAARSLRVRYLPRKDSPRFSQAARFARSLARAEAVRGGRAVSTVIRQVRKTNRSGMEAFRRLQDILPILGFRFDLAYFGFGGLAARYCELIEAAPFPCAFSLRGTDLAIEPLHDPAYAGRLSRAIRAARGVHLVAAWMRGNVFDLAGTEVSARVVRTMVPPEYFQVESGRGRNARSRFRIVSVGRLDWKKGLEYGLLATRALMEARVAFQWQILGDGPLRTALDYGVRDLGLESCVSLEGVADQERVRRSYAEADVLLHPALSEGLSNVVAEAMAAGLPVIGFDIPGMAEPVRSGVTGLLVPPRDWRALGAALVALAREPRRREAMGHAGRERAERLFAEARHVTEFREFLLEAIHTWGEGT